MQNKEINEEEYQHFQQCLANLTVKELDIFKLYLDGKSSKQIQEICAITSNTLKYHNANIYSKLGIKSRKELLTYATMMKRKRATGCAPLARNRTAQKQRHSPHRGVPLFLPSFALFLLDRNRTQHD